MLVKIFEKVTCFKCGEGDNLEVQITANNKDIQREIIDVYCYECKNMERNITGLKIF